LHSSDLPLISGLDLRSVSQLRLQEGVMADWRIALREAARGLSALPVEGERFAADSRQVLEDMLGQAERQIAKEASVLSRLRHGGREASVQLLSGAAATGTTAAVLGGPPVGLITAGVSAAASWALAALLPAKQSGVAHVVAHLRQGKV
jgi:hypothetical protein